jgi:hypothetical protein
VFVVTVQYRRLPLFCFVPPHFRVKILTTLEGELHGSNRAASGSVVHDVVPETDLHRVLAWAGRRVPQEINDKVRMEVDTTPSSVTILECRPPWNAPRDPNWTRHPVARLRYVQSTKLWTLYWSDRNLKFHRYDRVEPTPTIQNLLDEIDADPTAIFWG